MKLRKRNFCSAALRVVLVVPFDGRGNAAAIIHDRNGVVGMNRDFNVRCESGKRLINGVVDNFIDEMVQARTVGRVADIHSRAFSYGL